MKEAEEEARLKKENPGGDEASSSATPTAPPPPPPAPKPKPAHLMTMQEQIVA